MKRAVGKVYLIGAGPGDPGLITKRGYDILKFVDRVVVDDLVNPAFVRARPSSQVIYVGRRGPGAPRGSYVRLNQSGTNALLIRLAKQGLTVARLKGGDPFIFGRGGEEVEALRKKKVPFEVVPGVTSAVAAPAYAGIPLTDRRWVSQVTILTAQEGELRHSRDRVDWTHLSPNETLVILMGVSKWPTVQKRLLSLGWSKTRPVAAIQSGTTKNQKIILSTLQDSNKSFKKEKLLAPAVIVVGDVARYAKTLAWIKKEKPLLGKKIVVTRASHQNNKMKILLEEKGADVIVCPSIQVDYLHNEPERSALLSTLSVSPLFYDWIVFLSANGVHTFARLLGGQKNQLKKFSICAVGPQTKDTAERYGWKVKKVAKVFNAAGVLNILGKVKGKRILIPRVSGGPPGFTQALKKRGALVEEVATYRTRAAAPPSKELKAALLSGVDAVTFTSASTVQNFLSYFSPSERKRLFKTSLAASIGPSTSAALRKHKIKKTAQAKKATLDDLVAALCRKLAS